MKNKFSLSNWPREIIRWGVILTIIILAILPTIKKGFTPDFEAFCPFGGVQALGSYLLNHSLACTMTSSQILMGILMMVGVVLLSKLFCGYVCPIGTFSEWFGKLGDKLNIRITIKGIADKILRSLKYILLFITLYFTLGSNELFCKKFDPYYAVTTSFSIEVVVLYAVIAITLVVLGSIFIRLFFCKYVCPFGAFANTLKFTGFFLIIIVVYVVLLKTGLELNYVWPLAIACAGGYIIEIFGIGGRIFPVAKITRNEDTCINCNLCNKSCPQAIDVANVNVVKHVDCNLCEECIESCPIENTIQINKKRNLRWLPPFATVVIIVLGLSLKNAVEVPTIDQQWVPQEEMSNMAIFTQDGLRSIKCYGSSMAFAGKMKRVKGVYGMATYVGTHKVKILYDSTCINPEKIQKAFFTPLKKALIPIPKEVNDVIKVKAQLENFFDAYDFNYLSILLKQQTNALGLRIEFGCPVIVYIYFKGDEVIDRNTLADLLETKKINYEAGNKIKVADLGYKVAAKIETEIITRGNYINELFESYQVAFNDYDKYDSLIINKYRIPLGKNAALAKRFSYLVSHISNNPGIIKFETTLDKEYKQVIDISFIDSLVNEHEIHKLLTSDTLFFTYRDGSTGTTENVFEFPEEGFVLENGKN